MAKAKPITGLDASAPTAKNARIIAKARLAEMYEWDVYVDEPYRVKDLHNLRIAAKRLRYTLEIFQAALPEESVVALKEIVQIQEELGTLHDTDVMIALLRLCLGSQDSGASYEHVLTEVPSKGDFTVNPILVSYLLDPAIAPSAEQRQGLEKLLLSLHQQREDYYAAFRKHWFQLKGRDFRREIITILDTE